MLQRYNVPLWGSRLGAHDFSRGGPWCGCSCRFVCLDASRRSRSYALTSARPDRTFSNKPVKEKRRAIERAAWVNMKGSYRSCQSGFPQWFDAKLFLPQHICLILLSSLVACCVELDSSKSPRLQPFDASDKLSCDCFPLSLRLSVCRMANRILRQKLIFFLLWKAAIPVR